MRRDRFTPVTSPGTRLDPVLGKGAAAREPPSGFDSGPGHPGGAAAW